MNQNTKQALGLSRLMVIKSLERGVVEQSEIKKRETKKQVTRSRIMLSAVALFRRKGYAGTTVRDIATEVGILSGSLFHHFSSKEDILREAIAEAIEQTLEKMREEVAVSDCIEQALLALIKCELEAVTGERSAAVGLLINEWRSLSEVSQSAMLALREEYEAVWLEVLRSAERQKKISVEPFMLRKLLAGALNWTHTWYREGGEYQLEEIAERVLSMALSSKSV